MPANLRTCTIDAGDRRHARGFSLIELVITMALITILSLLAVPAYSKMRQRFYDTTALSDVINAGKALAALDGATAFSQTVRGPGPIRLLPGPYVSRGTTLIVRRAIGRNGAVTYSAQGTHTLGTGATFIIDQTGTVSATGAKVP